MDQISNQAPQSYQALINAQKSGLHAAPKATPSQPQLPHNSGRTAGAMPVWSGPKNIAPQGFAPHMRSDELSFDQLIAAETPSKKGNIAQKYTRDTDPNYADVSIGDFIDIINPLHHIPVVGNLYRGITGDEIKPPARIMGGGIFGGPLGMASAMVNTVVEDQTGGDIGENIVSTLLPSEPSNASPKNAFTDTPTYYQQASNETTSNARPMSFSEAKAYYAQNHAAPPVPQNKNETDKASHAFFSDDNTNDITRFVNNPEKGNEPLSASPSALNFVPTGNIVNHDLEASFGSGRTSGAMPSFSPETISLKQKNALAAELRMDDAAAREPVTSVTFE